jgi:predicted PurR-regulated permease PerM
VKNNKTKTKEKKMEKYRKRVFQFIHSKQFTRLLVNIISGHIVFVLKWYTKLDQFSSYSNSISSYFQVIINIFSQTFITIAFFCLYFLLFFLNRINSLNCWTRTRVSKFDIAFWKQAVSNTRLSNKLLPGLMKLS